jgi:TRAP-type C4-dicarboxylate transport system substrate-binding protein
MTGHFTAFTGPIINEDLYQSMSEALRAILAEAAVEAGTYMAELVSARQGEFRARLEAEGVTFVDDVDRAALREATAVVYQAFPKWSEGLHDRIRALLDE